MKRMKPTSAGFSLIEVMVALAIFSITSLAATRLIMGSTAMISVNNTTSRAIALGQGAIENLRNVAYADMVDGSDVVSWKHTDFTITWAVSANDPAPNMKTIVVNVAWQVRGETKQYEIKSIYSQVTA